MWCVYEVYVTLSLKMEVHVAFSPAQHGRFMTGVIDGNREDGGDGDGLMALETLIGALDIEGCVVEDHDDKVLIRELMQTGHVGLGLEGADAPQVNTAVQRVLRKWLSDASGGRAGSISRV